MISIPSHLGEVIEAGGTVVVPSRQRAHALSLAYAAAQLARGLRVWLTPDVLPLEGWLTREITRSVTAGDDAAARRLPRLLSPAEEWLLWQDGTAEAAGHLELVNRAALAEDLRRASRLALELQLDPDAVSALPGTETALWIEVHRAVQARARDLGAASLASVLPRIGVLGDARTLLWAGFLSASPLLRAVSAAREDRGRATRWPAGAADPLRPPRVERPADEIEELDRIAEWCRLRLQRQPQERLLIVLPGPDGRRERLAALIRQAIDPGAGFEAVPRTGALVTVEGGGALSRLPAVAHALETLGLLCGETLEVERLGQWLLAPFWSVPSLEGRARLELWLREHAQGRLDRRELLAALRAAPGPLEAAARPCAQRIEQAESALRPDRGSPREWSERFRSALGAFGWPGAAALSSAEQQTLLRFHELLDEFGQLSSVLGALEPGAAWQRLGALAMQVSYHPAEEDGAVTLTAALANPVVRYDALWVAGLHAEALPQPPAPDPFVPLAAQLAAGWPGASAGGRLAEAHRLLAAWRAAAPEQVLSAPRRSDDLDLLPSPLLARWPVAQAVPAPDAELGRVWLASRVHRPGLLEPWRDAGLPWDVREPLPGGSRSLELQNQCPFRAYAELRLGCTELAPSEPGVPSDLRGRLLHAALQRLWRTLGDSRALEQLAPPALDAHIRDSLAQAFAEVLAGAGASVPPAALARESRRTERLVRQLLDLERTRPAFRVQHTEYERRIDLAGIGLRVRLDRIDALEGGGLAILDYKSGRPMSADWYGERPSHPQLLTYLSAVSEPVVALATVHVTAREVRFQGIGAEAGLLPGVAAVKAPPRTEEPWEAQVRAWRERIERLARDFVAGQAPVDPKPGACEYCPLESLCRIAEGVPADTADLPPEPDA